MSNKAIYIIALLTLCVLAKAQKVELLKQQNLSRWNITHANYSGICHIDSTLYAVVDDKSFAEGFFIFNIDIDLKTGHIKSVSSSPLKHPSNTDKHSKYADCEDIVFAPWTNTVFINSESTGTVKEYTMQGELTGRELEIPAHMKFDRQSPNGGFEALACDTANHTFWLTTENNLKADSLITDANGKKHQQLRIIQFNENLKSANQWLYIMEEPLLSAKAKYYTHGVPAITSLPDGRLLVLERELSIPPHYIGSKSKLRIFAVNPQESKPGTPLTKREITSFTTHMQFGLLNYANYEGMCLGPKLADGRQTLLLINDSQAGAGNFIRKLQDYIKVLILPENLNF